jgi:transcriptional regulator with XRE-family HTH domain
MTVQDHQSGIRTKMARRRRQLGLTQEDMAGLLHVGRVTYHRMETGARTIRFEELAQICDVLQCGVADLLDDIQAKHTYERAAKALLGSAD